MDFICAALFVIVPLVFWGWLMIHYLRKFAGIGKRFNYRITDLWMALVCLSPACCVLGKAFKSQRPGELLLVGGLSFVGTLGGLVLGRIHIELPPHQGARNNAESAVSILTGALIGWAFFPVPLLVPGLSLLLILEVK